MFNLKIGVHWQGKNPITKLHGQYKKKKAPTERYDVDGSAPTGDGSGVAAASMSSGTATQQKEPLTKGTYAPSYLWATIHHYTPRPPPPPPPPPPRRDIQHKRQQ